MLILNPERLQATTAPLLPRQGELPGYAAIVRLTLAALTAIAAVTIGYAVTQYLGEAWPSWSVLVAVAAFVYLASLTAIVIDGIRWQVPLAVIWGASFALGLPWRTGPEAFALAGILAFSGIAAFLGHRAAVRSYASVHIFGVVQRYASLLATGVIVALIVLYGAAVSRGSALLPQGVLAAAADRAARFVPTLVPGVAPSGTSTVSVYDLALASAKAQLSDDPRYLALGPAEQARMLAEAAQGAAQSFARQFGGGTASSSIGTAVQGTASTLLAGFRDRYGWYFTIAWLLGAFFIARSAAIVLTLAVSALAWLTVTAALAAGLLRIEAIPSVRERITF